MKLYPFGSQPIPIKDFEIIEPYGNNLIRVTFKDGTHRLGEFIR
jgi:hypothetical protein